MAKSHVEYTTPGSSGKLVGPVVFRVLTKDDLGRPKTVEVGFDDSVFDLDNGQPREFVTGALHESAFKVAAKGRA